MGINSGNLPVALDSGYTETYDSWFEATGASAVIDVLSTGSITLPSLTAAQRSTWASPASVRSFYSVNELNDTDSTCHTYRTPESVYEESGYCRKKNPHYGHKRWLAKKGNPVGWFCAQSRPPQGLGMLARRYRATGEVLPDWLLIVDDDTYFGLDLLRDALAPYDAGKPWTWYSCLVDNGLKANTKHLPEAKDTFPFGGFGMALSRGSLERLLLPLKCDQGGVGGWVAASGYEGWRGDFESQACSRMSDGKMKERDLFKDGLALSDLIWEIASQAHFCMHSDHFTGYFTNSYLLGGDVGPSELPGGGGGTILGGNGGGRTGACYNQVKELEHVCKVNDLVCHQMTAEMMESVETSRKLKGRS